MGPLGGQGLLEWDRLDPVTAAVVYQVFFAALGFMVLAALLKIRRLLKLPAAREYAPPRGEACRGVRYAYLALAIPWELESQRRDWSSYAEFACLHTAVALNLATAIALPFAHGALGRPWIITALHWIFLAGAAAGFIRLANRLARPDLRAISAPEDYLCLTLLLAWMLTGLSAITQQSGAGLRLYYLLATLLLVAVPFSKLSHFIYFPFLRYQVGKRFGQRGVYPRRVLPGAG